MVTIILIHIVMAMIAAALAAAIVVELMLQLVVVETVLLEWPVLIGLCAAWIAVAILGMFLPYSMATALAVCLAVSWVYWLVRRSRLPWKV